MSEFKTNPTCTHCGYIFSEDETWTCDVDSDDGGLSELICPWPTCEKTFYTICVHNISWGQCDEDGDYL